ncbi:MAG: alpha/beta hydrolase [Proteobacteria bacterium]|nr:alpha/beta hydrolase [Pseudomonadota bacterium]
MSLLQASTSALRAATAAAWRRTAHGPLVPGRALRLDLVVAAQRAALETLVPLEPEHARRLVELSGKLASLPKDIALRAETLGGVPVQNLTEKNAEPRGACLYFHGGGFVLGSVTAHRDLLVRLARASRARVVGVEYRLAPEHPYPSALVDAENAYLALLDQGLAPDDIVLGGDSAGGNLCLALLQRLRSSGSPLPAGIALLSPWLDLEAASDTFDTYAETDYLTRSMALRWSAQYRGGHEPRDPLVSPLHMDPNKSPPLLVHAGGAETLRGEIETFVERARAAGVSVEFEIYSGMPHDWHLMSTWLPEARRALTEVGEFISQRISSP